MPLCRKTKLFWRQEINIKVFVILVVYFKSYSKIKPRSHTLHFLIYIYEINLLMRETSNLSWSQSTFLCFISREQLNRLTDWRERYSRWRHVRDPFTPREWDTEHLICFVTPPLSLKQTRRTPLSVREAPTQTPTRAVSGKLKAGRINLMQPLKGEVLNEKQTAAAETSCMKR